MPKRSRIVVIERRIDGFTALLQRAIERRCVRCGCSESRACAGGCSWVFPGVDICSKCWTPADQRLQEEKELLRDALESVNDLLFRVEHCLKFYGEKGARP